MAWYEKLINGTAVKDKNIVSCKVPSPPGATGRFGIYDVVDCSLSIGRIADSQSTITGEYSLTGTLDTSGDSCLLPWGFDRLCWMQLGTQAKFLTYQLNGCGVLISGDRGSPVVVHANESGDNLDKSIQNDGIKSGERRRGIYDSAIPYLTQNIPGFTGGDNIAKWYPGLHYQGRGAVFGVRVNGAWKIYGHACNGKNSTTTQIWPRDAVLDENESRNHNQCKCCFITTAVCQSLGLSDDCEELNTLRWFRDEIMKRSDNGRSDVETYYLIAPAIVAAIDRRDDAGKIYRGLYKQNIVPALSAIRAGSMELAYELYRNMVEELLILCNNEEDKVSKTHKNK